MQHLDQVETEAIELWGNMSSAWGLNPTMARIHGLLFITGASLTVEKINEKLGASRGNISMNLAKLLEWGIVRRVHKPGFRSDKYEAIRDVWEMVQLIALARKRREIDPVLATLRRQRDSLLPLRNEQPGDANLQERFRRINDLVTVLSALDSLTQICLQNADQLRAALELLAAHRQEPAGSG